jgi:hypothetical protein
MVPWSIKNENGVRVMMTNSCFKTSSIVPSVLANHGAAVVQASSTNASYGRGEQPRNVHFDMMTYG